MTVDRDVEMSRDRNVTKMEPETGVHVLETGVDTDEVTRSMVVTGPGQSVIRTTDDPSWLHGVSANEGIKHGSSRCSERLTPTALNV